MDHQLRLDTLAAAHNVAMPGLRVGRYLTMREAFAEWRASDDGALVYAELRRRALALARRGWKQYSHKALIESIRYSRDIRLGTSSGWRCNDHHSAFLARELMAAEPALAGFFPIREQRA